ncbi:hypothetical protein [Streptomyces sp. NPDC050560]|uniref:hypothetical protein n=1 Tax=Streptomyces sp. NPDC050560 TaxID=3365630 RepID=UPI00379E4733
MTDRAARAALAEDVAAAVEAVPGVAFLRPGFGRLLRTALPGDRTGATAGAAGVRLTRDKGTGPWHLDIMLVALRTARTVDVAREAREAARACLTTHPFPDDEPHIRVTVTGLV